MQTCEKEGAGGEGVKMDWKSAEEYLHWKQFLSYMPMDYLEFSAECLGAGDWPNEECIAAPEKEREKRRLTALLPELISQVMKERRTGEEGGCSGNERCNDIPQRVYEAGQTLLLRTEVFHAPGMGNGNRRAGGERTGDPADITHAVQGGSCVIDVLFGVAGVQELVIRDGWGRSKLLENAVFEGKHAEDLLSCSVKKVTHRPGESKKKVINSQRIKERMKLMKVSQAQLGKALGLKAPTVSQKINNIRPMLLHEAAIIAEELDIGSDMFCAFFFWPDEA